jgi:hypothetical protein
VDVTAPTGVVPCEPWDPIICVPLPAGASATVTGAALEAATEILWARSGRQFGTCEITLRPCRRTCDGDWPWFDNWWDVGGGGPRPLLYQGAWFNIVCGGCPNGCSCSVVEETVLPAPVHSVTEVKLNGSVMVTGSYRVDNHRLLVRTDGGVWPICQDMAAPDTADNTWSVRTLYGNEVPASGRFAVGELMAEIAKACVGAACAIPGNATQVSRQGVTIDMAKIADLLEKGLLGLPMSDRFITTFNPKRLLSKPRVYDVDAPFVRRPNTS